MTSFRSFDIPRSLQATCLPYILPIFPKVQHVILTTTVVGQLVISPLWAQELSFAVYQR